jgi:hypothetical protein
VGGGVGGGRGAGGREFLRLKKRIRFFIRSSQGAFPGRAWRDHQSAKGKAPQRHFLKDPRRGVLKVLQDPSFTLVPQPLSSTARVMEPGTGKRGRAERQGQMVAGEGQRRQSREARARAQRARGERAERGGVGGKETRQGRGSRGKDECHGCNGGRAHRHRHRR